MTRFEDNLRRDLHVIADRATPSSDAWDSILTRIADREPIQETEIIMLTDNTMPTRRWPLVVAAAAVIALLVGAIATFGSGGSDDPIPLDTVPSVEPDEVVTDADDAEERADDDADESDGAEPTADPADDADPDPADAPRTVSLEGRLSEVLAFSPPDGGGAGTFSGDHVLTGDMVGVGVVRGSYVTNAAGGLDGRYEAIFSVDTDDIGDGTLVIEEQWTSSSDGSSEHTGFVTAGTGAFLGATGTFTYVTPDGVDDPTARASAFGDYTLELVLPPAATVDVGTIQTADGRLIRSSGLTGTNEFVEFDDGTEGRRTYTYTSTHTDPSTGSTSTGFGHELVVRAEPTFGIGVASGPTTIDGIGSGTGEWLSYWTTGTVIDNQSFLIGATGDLAGYTAVGRSFSTNQGRDWDGFSEFTPGTPYISVTATGTWSDDGYTETPRPDSPTLDVAYTTNVDGDAVGVGVGTGVRTPNEDGSWGSGANTVEFTGAIAGLGDGTLTFEERFSTTTEFSSVGVITDGTGDFAGARGIVRFLGATTYEFDIEVPIDVVERPRVIELSTTWTDRGFVESPRDDGGVVSTGLVQYDGQVQGLAALFGSRTPDGELSVSTSDLGFSGTIEGVGTGTLTLRHVSVVDPSGTGSFATVITGGTGDFTDAGGWMLSPGDGSLGVLEIELRLPAAG